MPAVAVVTVQKELFKNVAEILLEAQAAGNLISERLGKGGGGGRGDTPAIPRVGSNIAGSGDRVILWGCVFLQIVLGSSLLSS